MTRRRDHVRMLVAPDLRQFIGDEPAAGFLEWCEATAETMAKANTPAELIFARLFRAMVVATVETANKARRDGGDEATVAVFVPRAAMLAASAALISVLKDDTETAFLRDMLVREVDFAMAFMAPGKTIGDKQ